jgi:hypothetical protein
VRCGKPRANVCPNDVVSGRGALDRAITLAVILQATGRMSELE